VSIDRKVNGYGFFCRCILAKAMGSTLKRTNWLKPSESVLKRAAASVFSPPFQG
jgi:hypothetical protein